MGGGGGESIHLFSITIFTGCFAALVFDSMVKTDDILLSFFDLLSLVIIKRLKSRPLAKISGRRLQDNYTNHENHKWTSCCSTL